MAFKDSDGKITIDEIAARADISRIQAAIDHYNAAIDDLKSIESMSSEIKGEAADSVRDISALLREQVRLMSEASEVTIGSVNSVVSKYKKLDAQLRDMIAGSSAGRQV